MFTNDIKTFILEGPVLNRTFFYVDNSNYLKIIFRCSAPLLSAIKTKLQFALSSEFSETWKAAELQNICRNTFENKIKGAEHRNIAFVFHNNTRNDTLHYLLISTPLSRCAFMPFDHRSLVAYAPKLQRRSGEGGLRRCALICK